MLTPHTIPRPWRRAKVLLRKGLDDFGKTLYLCNLQGTFFSGVDAEILS